MAELIDLGLVTDAQRLLEKLIERHGIAWFLARDGKSLVAIEKSKVELVVKTALRARARRRQPVVRPAVEHCRKQVRRDLIRRIAVAMLQSGC